MVHFENLSLSILKSFATKYIHVFNTQELNFKYTCFQNLGSKLVDIILEVYKQIYFENGVNW